MPIASINPANGETFAVYEPLTKPEVLKAVEDSSHAFRTYRSTTITQRAAWLNAAAGLLEEEHRALGRTITEEMGKPITAAREEVLKCARVCRYYAEHGAAFLADEEIPGGTGRSFVRYQPLGPVLAVMPWNFPFWQVFRFAAPALMAGNTGLLKHSSNVPRCATAIEDIFLRAGFPPRTFITLLIGSDLVPAVIGHPAVQAVTLTGSTPAGSSVASLAGKYVKKTLLELGGSDPFIVMPGSPLPEAAAAAVRARVVNNGQSCIAAKRFIVHQDIYREFTEMFVRGMEGLRVGPPMEETTDVGPLATKEILEELEQQVDESVKCGAKVLMGGTRIAGAGNYYRPTILAEIPHSAPVFRDEVFGPVALLFRARDIDEAIAIANYSSFGLGSSAWTPDPSEQERFVNELEAGLVFINGMVVSDPRLPFGGIKSSGYGRELGVNGIREFVNIKTVCMAPTA
jgi:succinate-semialdehyde dehydrogenase / glutarate-semialdehyde dehydrogenase